MDEDVINHTSNKLLSEFKSQYSIGSPQHIFATYEFQRRITKIQTIATYICCILSGLFGLAGVAIGFFLSRL